MFLQFHIHILVQDLIDLHRLKVVLIPSKAICCVMDRKVGVGRAGRFTQQGRKSPETHGPEGNVMWTEWSGPEGVCA